MLYTAILDPHHALCQSVPIPVSQHALPYRKRTIFECQKASPVPSSSRVALSRRLAVVEDDRDLRDLVAQIVVDWGWTTIPIPDGSRAGDLIACDVPDAVLLDLHLSSPQSGWTVLEALRTDPATCRIPIIIWSADVRQLEEKGTWLREQGISVLPKPFDIEDLSRLLDSVTGA